MSPTMQIVLSGALSFGVPLLVAFNELRITRRPSRGPGDPGRQPEPQPPPPLGSGPAQKPLPQSLIPNLSRPPAARPLAPRERERERELA